MTRFIKNYIIKEVKGNSVILHNNIRDKISESLQFIIRKFQYLGPDKLRIWTREFVVRYKKENTTHGLYTDHRVYVIKIKNNKV